MSQILVDSKAGSNDVRNAADGSLRHEGLARHIVPQELVRVVRNLPVDIFFNGNGPRGSTLDIGIEYKTIWDALDCVRSGRFSDNQLPALRECDFGILLIEGLVRRANDARGNRLEVYGSPLGKERGWYDSSEWGRGKRIWRYEEFEHWYWSMIFRGGVIVMPFTRDKWDSGRLVGSLYRAMNDKAWEEHTAHQQKSTVQFASLAGNLSWFTRAIMEYPGIGQNAALAANRAFQESMRSAANASVDTWAKLVVGGGIGKGGKKKRATPFGKKRAEKVVRALRGEK